ncbi:MAG: DUF72 domain-containing protein [Thermoproteus sp. AZ2]|uniref:DUF72 domain-containing protein n=1 Tax=Thermoproteus sp. AZ2 TaxID=1609232 RepID=A0ACC6V1L5_9CREN|nr:MAG: hypothetical protein TU35_02345 [Thermoproteus sp. AZ2]
MIVGTCGFPRARKEVYRRLDGVELQETFYNLPSEGRMAALRAEAPEGFVFTVKVFQGLTHPKGSPTYRRTRGFTPSEKNGFLRPTRENLELWDSFERLTAPLKPAVYVFQTPPNMPAELVGEALEFLRTIRGDARLAWEPRGPAAEAPGLAEKLAELGVALAVDPFRRPPRPSPFYYFRLHGIGGGEVNYRYKYSDEDLRRLLDIARGREPAYVFFNNVYMFDDAVRFRELAKGLSTSGRV